MEMQKVDAIGEIIAHRLFAIVTSPHSKWDVTTQTTSPYHRRAPWNSTPTTGKFLSYFSKCPYTLHSVLSSDL